MALPKSKGGRGKTNPTDWNGFIKTSCISKSTAANWQSIAARITDLVFDETIESIKASDDETIALSVFYQLAKKAARAEKERQQFPEVYEGDALLVNLAVKQMPAQLRPFMDLHYTLGRGATNRADLLGISRAKYWARVKAAKLFIEGYLAARADRAA